MAVNIKAKLLKKEELKPGIFKFSVQADEIIKTAKPGNFIEIRVNNDIEPFLRFGDLLWVVSSTSACVSTYTKPYDYTLIT